MTATQSVDDREGDLRRVLRKYWGYDSFLPLQSEAMQCVVAGRDSVVVLSTGGGKSLCFQAPAMVIHGLAVVISPLISLMKDQVDALRSCGIPAACVNSTLALDERRHVADEIRAGRLRLLYVAPERLLADRTLEFLQTVDVSLLAIDEAHCISSWGHDFRPEYRALSVLREKFPGVAIHAYTATATERVRTDIVEQLRLKNARVIVGSFDRPNLVYKVQRRNNSLQQIRSVLDRHPGPSGIIYCISRAEVDRTSAALNELGYLTLAYHAGMSNDERQRNQDAFIEAQVNTIVATVAFGMGIDKSNIRYVVHAGMPKSLESYQQESGRAGRDGLEAECCLFYSGGDYGTWKRMLDDLESKGRDGALNSLGAMFNFCSGVECRHRALVEYFGQSWHKSTCEACDVCLGDLDLVEDPVTIGKKILSCVLRVEQRFGSDYVSLVLSGSRDRRVLQNGHDQLSTWGILDGESRRSIRDWIEQLVSQEFLQKTGEYNVLNVTPEGRQLLRSNVKPRLLRPAEKKTKKRQAASFVESWTGVERGLFETLRAMRRQKAALLNVPPYIIFGDVALRDMARRRPSSLEGFLQVRGVGEKKCDDFGTEFIDCINSYCSGHDISQDETPPAIAPSDRPAVSGPTSSSRKAFELFEERRSVEEVARHLNRAESTVYGYLGQYIQHRRITDPAPWVDRESTSRIQNAIRRLGFERLRPISNALGGHVRYEDIRVVVKCWKNTAGGGV